MSLFADSSFIFLAILNIVVFDIHYQFELMNTPSVP